jgi:hypothetical protein
MADLSKPVEIANQSRIGPILQRVQEAPEPKLDPPSFSSDDWGSTSPHALPGYTTNELLERLIAGQERQTAVLEEILAHATCS